MYDGYEVWLSSKKSACTTPQSDHTLHSYIAAGRTSFVYMFRPSAVDHHMVFPLLPHSEYFAQEV